MWRQPKPKQEVSFFVLSRLALSWKQPTPRPNLVVGADDILLTKRFELHDAPPNCFDYGDKGKLSAIWIKNWIHQHKNLDQDVQKNYSGEFNMTVDVTTQEEKQEWVDRLMMKIMIMNLNIMMKIMIMNHYKMMKIMMKSIRNSSCKYLKVL